MRRGALLALAFAAACVPAPQAEVSMNRARAAIAPVSPIPPAMQGFGLRPAEPAARSNASIAQDFLELSFRMESGRALARFSRFEGPVTVRLAGSVPEAAATDFDRLLVRLRREAGIDIREVISGPASITVEFLPRARIQQVYSNVACFVVPRVSSWQEFQSARGSALTDWTTLERRETVAIFIPSDGAAQEARDCLHEEMAQALGPINDLYRLTDSVFNDDNFHNTLTGFDMLVLRATYAPELRAGMTEEEVARRLPAILDRLNPGGRGGAEPAAGPTPRQWVNQIETALGAQSPLPQRQAAARGALAFAQAQGWGDGRLALSWYALGRLTLARDPETAVPALRRAAEIWRRQPGGQAHAAHVDMQLAAHALASGDPRTALRLARAAMPSVERAENAALMATLMMMQAEALDLLGQPQAAAALRLDSAGWARYGFGPEEQVRARASEIAALARRGGG